MTEDHWQALCQVMDSPAWVSDARFSDAQGRVNAADELDALIGAWTAQQDAYELMARLQHAGVPAGVVQDGEDLQQRDPQLEGFFEELTDMHPQLGQTWVDHLPIHFESTPCQQYERVRALGEDNAAVLADWLGLDTQQTDRLREVGALD